LLAFEQNFPHVERNFLLSIRGDALECDIFEQVIAWFWVAGRGLRDTIYHITSLELAPVFSPCLVLLIDEKATYHLHFSFERCLYPNITVSESD